MDALAAVAHGKPFLQVAPAEQVAILERLSAAERQPGTDEERFFVELKRRTVHAYYTSRIGIHDEMKYQGNVLLQEFAGIDVSHDR